MTTSKKVSKHTLCDVPDSGKPQVTFPKKGRKTHTGCQFRGVTANWVHVTIHPLFFYWVAQKKSKVGSSECAAF